MRAVELSVNRGVSVGDGDFDVRVIRTIDNAQNLERDVIPLGL